MEGNRSKPRVLLVFGAPCSGKTTFAEKFAKKFNLTYYNLEEIANTENLLQAGLLDILTLIARTHATVVLEGCIDTEKDRAEIRNIFRAAGYEPSLIWIQTDLNTIKLRLRSRFKTVSAAKQAYEDAINRLEAPSEVEAPIILSGKHTFETQTKHVLAGLADVN
ncbi:AAA family ATPase [Candidatus Saccharibacteria bacterium]|nr:AAA family ATPase [Candidatus Saccharibacteria bacterium]